MKKYAGGLSLLALAVCCSPAVGQSSPPRNDVIEDRLSPGNDRDVQGGAGFENDGREGRIQGRVDADDARRVRDVESNREDRLNRGDREERMTRDQRNQRADRENWNEERRNAARDGNEARIQMFYTKKLENMNNSVVQLSRFAEQRSEARDIQEFAQKLAQGHSELNARLESLNAEGEYAERDNRDDEAAQRRSAAYRGNRNDDRNADRDNVRQEARDEVRDEAREQARDRNDVLAEVDKRAYQNRNQNARNAERNWDERDQAKHDEHAKHGEQAKHDDRAKHGDHGRAMAAHQGQSAALKQICKIEKEAAQNYLDRTQQMLERYNGQDFDMAFLGFQIGSHTWALSELNAMQGVGDEEFQKVVADAKQKMEQHLKQAKQLSKKYEDKEGSNRDRNRDRG
ncbi:hypothetical protein [Rubinisphaera sp. JC750]|uniref:hypothetical protein n=1 Tax=Rubinisphaera sp. JC750 TaxID=2898658 RepID=UPI001F3C5C5B|nr:hypothetical protein [Rubinisphaera sp. JC750]